jgi:hypothetical protein
MNTKNRNRELVRLINGMEALGCQVEVIEVLPGGDVRAEPDRGLITIKASFLYDNTTQRETTGARRQRALMEPLGDIISAAT